MGGAREYCVFCEVMAGAGPSSSSYFSTQPGKNCRVCSDFKSWTKSQSKKPQKVNDVVVFL